MFQVFVAASGGGPNFNLGPQVESLAAARTVVKMGDWLFDVLELSHGQTYQHLPEHFAVKYWEGADVYVKEVGTDRLWSYHDQDPSGASDGIWDLES